MCVKDNRVLNPSKLQSSPFIERSAGKVRGLDERGWRAALRCAVALHCAALGEELLAREDPVVKAVWGTGASSMKTG